MQSVGDFHAAQATAEVTLADALNHYAANTFVAKETLTNRQFLLRGLEGARRVSMPKPWREKPLAEDCGGEHAAVFSLKSKMGAARLVVTPQVTVNFPLFLFPFVCSPCVLWWIVPARRQTLNHVYRHGRERREWVKKNAFSYRLRNSFAHARPRR